MDSFQTLKRARVLILFPHMVTPGGALNYALRLAGEFAEQGATVAVLVMRVKKGAFTVPPGVDLLSIDGPMTSSLHYWLMFPLWQKRINRTISDWQPDVIIPQVFPSNWWGWLYKRAYPGTALAWVCHEPSAFIHSDEVIDGLRPFWKRWLAKWLQPLLRTIDLYLVCQSDRVLANSLYTAGRFEQVYGRKVDSIASPGIDLNLFSTGGKHREIAIITVGHLVPYKRIDFLVRVFAQLRKKFPKLIFHIVGEGPEAGKLQQLTNDLGIAADVVFHGKMNHSELAALNRRMLLFLFAGINETFGMAPLEAIACGTPVVAHNSGGPREFVNQNCGLLIDSLEIDDWVGEISGYLDQLQRQGVFPEEVRNCALNFNWQQTLRPAMEVVGRLCVNVTRTNE